MPKVDKRKQERREALKRWRKRAPDAAISIRPVGLRASDRMADTHPDVLQNIEFMLVQCYQEDERVDDLVVMRALKASILEDNVEDPCTQVVVEGLAAIRSTRSDVTDEIWRQGLRVVMSSVQRHSSLRAGSVEYLSFVEQFIM